MDDRVTLGHGGGGRLTQELVAEVFAAALSNPLLDPLDDAARLPRPAGPLAMTTDSFVVSPLSFPGGDIGSLAIHGTVNDLAVSGAIPRHLTLGVILEEGLPLAQLRAIVESMAIAAARAGVQVVTGDTKVVERGKGDGMFVNTAGIGDLRAEWADGPPPPRPGDAILVSGPVGDHGAVILGSRLGLELPGGLISDSRAVTPLVSALFDDGIVPRFLRDPTRGGLAGVLCDLAEGSGLGVDVEVGRLPVRPDVDIVCDITGVDPLHLACEGRVVAVVAAEQWSRALDAWHRHEPDAACIGRVVEARPGQVVLTTAYGGQRLLARPAADQLPRIC
jgi:hydrogenase expression/formation protein HypE